MYNIEVIRADLWGNVKDGFDNNEEYYIGNEESSYTTDERLKRIARDYFAGRFLAFPTASAACYLIGAWTAEGRRS